MERLVLHKNVECTVTPKKVERTVTPCHPPAGFINLGDFFDCQAAADSQDLPTQSEVLELVKLGIRVKDAVKVVTEVGVTVHRRMMAGIKSGFSDPRGDCT